MKNKFFLVVFILIVSLFIDTSRVKAIDNACYIDSDDTVLVAGNTVKLNLYLRDIDVIVTQGYIEISYDSEVFEYIDATFYEGINLYVVKTTNNLVLNLSDGLIDLSSYDSDIELVSLTFKVKDGILNQATNITMYGLNVSYIGNDTDKYYCKSNGNNSIDFNIYDADNDTNLSYLTVSSGELTPGFSKSVTNYSVYVPYDVKSISINGKCVASGCVVTGLGTKGLSVGKNIYNIVVTSKSSFTKTYTITVTRDKNLNNVTEKKDNNADLKSLDVSVGDLEPKFSPSVTKYVVDVGADIDNIKISGVCSGIECTVSGTGTKYLSEGENSYDIKVIAEDGTVKFYNITVNRAYGLYLSSLLIDNYILTPSFNKDIKEYKINVGSEVNRLNIRAEANDSSSIIRIVGNNNFKFGENEINIYLTSSDGEEATSYKIIVSKEAILEEEDVIENNDSSIWDNGYVIVLGIIIGILLLVLIGWFVYYLLKKHNEIMENK